MHVALEFCLNNYKFIQHWNIWQFVTKCNEWMLSLENSLYHSKTVENVEKLENFMIINISMEANDRPLYGGARPND